MVSCPHCSIGVDKAHHLESELIPAELQDWLPPVGVDPRMRKYKCKAGHVFYDITGRKDKRADKGTQTEMFNVQSYNKDSQH